jgi:hypothetical protein
MLDVSGGSNVSYANSGYASGGSSGRLFSPATGHGHDAAASFGSSLAHHPLDAFAGQQHNGIANHAFATDNG